MLTKDTIIKNSLLKLGEIGSYNDNRTSIYKTSEALLEERLLDDIAIDQALMFNVVTDELTVWKDKKDNDITEEYIYNLPLDCMNVIGYIPFREGRREGEYVYSKEKELKIRYMRRIDITDVPVYMKNYLIILLAIRIAEIYNSYTDRVEYLYRELSKELYNVQKAEGFKHQNEKVYKGGLILWGIIKTFLLQEKQEKEYLP